MGRWKKVNQWLKFGQHKRCLLCLTKTTGDLICNFCEQELPWLKGAGDNSFDVLSTRALFAYESPVREFMAQFKFHHKLYFANWFASKMMSQWQKPLVDCIVALPLHVSRQQERGFNQTLEIAKCIASHWAIPLDKWSATRVKKNTPQQALSALHRRHNLKPSSFLISSGLKGKRVLVIEDVITTGTTLRAFHGALEKAGVVDIITWACCLTLKVHKYQNDASVL